MGGAFMPTHEKKKELEKYEKRKNKENLKTPYNQSLVHSPPPKMEILPFLAKHFPRSAPVHMKIKVCLKCFVLGCSEIPFYYKTVSLEFLYDSV